LKENFDRFNYAIYKEKEMADFRRLFTALALVALFVGLASAQGGLNGGGGTMNCATTTTVTPTVRSEGFTELVGDIVLNCTGGTAAGFGSQIPQANITVFLNTQVTSRILNTSSSNASEALLLIDEPGSATVSGYGASLAQYPCTTPLSGCVENVGNVTVGTAQIPSGSLPVSLAGVAVPVNPGTSTPAPNVFQGVVSGNSVTFFGVPILPPTTTGNRIFRITNIRANATGISGGGPTPGSITGSISISPSNAFTINQFTFTLAAVQQGLTTSLRNSTDTAGGGAINFNQCAGTSFNTSGAAGVLRFSENFPTAFKTRTALVNGNTSTTSSFTGQNIPGQVYNSESGFTQPAITNGSVVAGLADWGTRLKAVFTNVPSGVSIFVSTVNVVGLTTAAPTALGNPVAQQVITETVPDANGNLALTTPTNITSTGAVPYSQVTIVNGTGIAVWEVIQNNYTTNQNLDFGVFISYSASPQTNTPAPGPISVNQSYAPTPTNGAFSASSAADPTKVGIIPRFADTSSARTFAQINICQTVLLFPFVTTATGFETGLAIANTTQDPFGTPVQTGACTLNWYQAGTGGTNPAPTTTPAIPGGTVYSTLASNATNAGANFTGYMFAVCNFQYAHGYAAITDVGARGIFATYLPLVVTTGTGTRTSAAESLAH
jgi:hypothetical protein